MAKTEQKQTHQQAVGTGNGQSFLVSPSKMADMLQMPVRTLNYHVQHDECPRVSHGKFDIAQVIRWYAGYLRLLRERDRRDDTMEEAERRRAVARAQIAEIEAAERRGGIILVSEHFDIMEKIIIPAKTRLLALPAKVSPGLAHTDALNIQQTLSREIREALESVARGEAMTHQAVKSKKEPKGPGRKQKQERSEQD